jgi:hypothetical protein
MLIPPSALERAMQIKEVLLRAKNKEYSWQPAPPSPANGKARGPRVLDEPGPGGYVEWH